MSAPFKFQPDDPGAARGKPWFDDEPEAESGCRSFVVLGLAVLVVAIGIVLIALCRAPS